jgi:hypothetical protein
MDGPRTKHAFLLLKIGTPQHFDFAEFNASVLQPYDLIGPQQIVRTHACQHLIIGCVTISIIIAMINFEC